MKLPVRIKQCKLFSDNIRANQLPYLLNSEKEVFDKVYIAVRDNELYNKVWMDIEREANRIVEEECKPEWNRLIKQIEEAKTKITELEKAEEKDEEAIKANQEIVDNSMEQYQKVSDEANAKLNEFKEDYINNNYKDATCFLLDEEDYKLVDKIIGWSVYDWKNDTGIVTHKLETEEKNEEEE